MVSERNDGQRKEARVGFGGGAMRNWGEIFLHLSKPKTYLKYFKGESGKIVSVCCLSPAHEEKNTIHGDFLQTLGCFSRECPNLL